MPVMMEMADREYQFSCKATRQLKEAILNQKENYTEGRTQSKEVKANISAERNLYQQQQQSEHRCK